MITRTFVFGALAVQRVRQGLKDPIQLASLGEIKDITFQTEAEFDAYYQGISDGQGWSAFVEIVDARTKTA